MFSTPHRAIGLAAPFLVSAGLAAAPRSTPLVDFAPLPDFDGNPATLEIPNAVARSGTGDLLIAGASQDLVFGASTAFLVRGLGFKGGGMFLPLVTPPGGDVNQFSAEHISADGDRIVGFTLTDDFRLKPTVWDDPAQVPFFLSTPTGTTDASPDGMSLGGDAIVGGAFGLGDSPPALWEAGTGFDPVALDMPAGAEFGLANDVTITNGSTYAVGSYSDASFNEQAALWNGTHLAETLDSDLDDGTAFLGGIARGISEDAERIVGSVTDPSFNQIPAVWTDDTPVDAADFTLFTPGLPKNFESGILGDVLMADLTAFRGEPVAVATGSGTDNKGQVHALLFSETGGLRKLADVITNELGGSLGAFTVLTDIRDLKIDDDGGLLLVGLGDTADGPRGWVCRIHPADVGGPCNPADLAEPFGLLDLNDVTTFASAFISGNPLADLDDSGLLDLTDISLFVSAFTAGCP